MRLFVAVEISDEAREAAAHLAEQLRCGLGDAVTVRWTPPENAHLTVRFIGHVADERLREVLDVLSPPLPLAPYDVVLGGCGVFPRSGPPRVIWIGLKEGLPGLAAMHEEFNRRLAALGFEPETRPFSAHLTLARVKAASGPAVRRAVISASVPSVLSRVSGATVFESVLSPRGPRYRPILRVPLRTANRAS